MTALEVTLLEMVLLLEKNGEKEWSHALKQMAIQYQSGQASEAADKVRRSFGGMGSLNDLILQTGGIPSSDNGKFDILRANLFRLVTTQTN